MIKLQPEDILVCGHCPQSRLRVLFVDVAESARTLATRHGCGPAATLVLSEALAAAALLSADLADPAQTVSLRVSFPGPIQGVLVEACGNGTLRGYTDRKILPVQDARDDIVSEEVTGATAQVSVVRADSNGRILSQAALEDPTGRLTDILRHYYAHSLQLPALVALQVSPLEDRTGRARGMVLQCMPDGDAAIFQSLEPLFTHGTVSELLAFDASLDSVRELLSLPELRSDTTRTLQFGCRCSRERAEAVLAAMSIQELNGIRRAGRPQRVTCHLCGADYWFETGTIDQVIARKRGPTTN